MTPNDDFSFQLWSSRLATDSLEQQLRTLKALGYTDVQPYHDQYDDPEGMKRLLDKIGLTAKTGHFGMAMFEHGFDRVVANARTLGMTLVVGPWLDPHERPTDAAGWKRLGATLKDYTRRCAAEGLEFAWHNHEFEMLPLPDGSTPIEYVLGDEVPWEIDIAWVTRADVDPLPWIRRYAGRIPAVHVKDVAPKAAPPVEDGWADVGHGVLDWQTLWDASVAAGSRLMVAEHDAPADYRRFATRSIVAMKRFGAAA